MKPMDRWRSSAPETRKVEAHRALTVEPNIRDIDQTKECPG